MNCLVSLGALNLFSVNHRDFLFQNCSMDMCCSMQIDRLVHLRKLTDWAPLIVISALSGDYLRLALIIATAISAGNIVVDALLIALGHVKVSEWGDFTIAEHVGTLIPLPSCTDTNALFLTVSQVWPKLLDLCFFFVYGVTLILAYTISESIVSRWLQVITIGGIFLLLGVS